MEILPRARSCARLPPPVAEADLHINASSAGRKGHERTGAGGWGGHSFQRSLRVFAEEVIWSWVLEDEQTLTCFRKFKSQLGPQKRNPTLEELAETCTVSSRKESGTMNILKYKTKRRQKPGPGDAQVSRLSPQSQLRDAGGAHSA